MFDVKHGDTLILLGDRQLRIASPPKYTFDFLFQYSTFQLKHISFKSLTTNAKLARL